MEEREQLQQMIRGVEKKPLPHMLATTNLILHDVEVPRSVRDNSLARPLRLRPGRPRGRGADEPAVRRDGGARHREQLPCGSTRRGRRRTSSSPSS